MISNTHPDYRPDIDGLRAIAVVAVVVYHAFPARLPGGFVGVDIFFVISGYLISSIIFESLSKGKFSFLNFYVRRVRRIFPALILILAASAALGFFYSWPEPYRSLGKHIFNGSLFFSNIVLWREINYFNASEAFPLLHLWSLSVEEQYYLLWPAFLYLAWRRKYNIAICIGSVWLLSFCCNVWQTFNAPTAAFYLPFGRFWELLTGALLAYWGFTRAMQPKLVPASPWSPLSDLQAVCGLVLIVIATFWLSGNNAFPGLWALLPVVGTALLISAGNSGMINRIVLSNRALVLVGLVSYPLYLWHFPALYFAKDIFAGDRSMKVAAVVASFVLALLTFYCVERPIRRKAKTPSFAVWLSFVLAAVGLLGLIIWMNDGFASRFPVSVKALMNVRYDQAIREAYRNDRCLLNDEQTFRDFSSDCIDAPRNGRTAKLVVLWGDSHAAHLYPGLRHLQSQRGFDLAQFTTDGCPPLIGWSHPARPNCRANNNWIVDKISALRPTIVLVAARWGAYPMSDLELLAGTVSRLRNQGVKHVFVIGPVPTWAPSLPKVLVRYMKENSLPSPPLRMTYGLERSPFEREDKLRALVQGLGAHYVSSLQPLCDSDGCLTQVQSKPSELIAFDSGHFSILGSQFFVSSIAQQIFEVAD